MGELYIKSYFNRLDANVLYEIERVGESGMGNRICAGRVRERGHTWVKGLSFWGVR